MSDPYDPYREALVVEELTLWTDESREVIGRFGAEAPKRLTRRLHAEPATASHLEYVRVHTGFCRRITVQPGDIERHAESLSAAPRKAPIDGH